MREVLSRAGVAFTERDFFAQRFTEDELRDLLGDRSPREAFAARSPSAESLDVDPDALSDDELLRLMLQEPRLLRRPLLRIDGRLAVGVNAKSAEDLIAT